MPNVWQSSVSFELGSNVVKQLAKRRASHIAQCVFGDWYNRRQDENLAILHALNTRTQIPVSYPASYVEFLRDCLRPQQHRIKIVKTERFSASAAAVRFETLVDTLKSGVPPLPMGTAQEIGQVADIFFANTQSFVSERWISDVGLNFGGSSSFGRVGRLISCIIRLMKSGNCLELGTAYGLSALFTLAALQRNSEAGHLTTLEGGELQFVLASNMLREKYTTHVSCYQGMTAQMLPSLVPTLGMIDFFFHDAGHSRKDYTVNFGLVEPVLGPGSVMLVDDIHWSNHRYFRGNPRAYAGWKAIVRHSRVEDAIEIDGKLGLVLLR